MSGASSRSRASIGRGWVNGCAGIFARPKSTTAGLVNSRSAGTSCRYTVGGVGSARVNSIGALRRGLIGGFTPVDLRWQDLKSVQINAGVFASDLSVTGLSQPDLASSGSVVTLTFDGLRKDEAQGVYRICQAQEEAWREKRRLRELENCVRNRGASSQP
jgi:hypothetical protein